MKIGLTLVAMAIVMSTTVPTARGMFDPDRDIDELDGIRTKCVGHPMGLRCVLMYEDTSKGLSGMGYTQ